MGKEVKQWITVNGVHVPIFEGESKEQAVKNALQRMRKKGPESKKDNYKTPEQLQSLKEDAEEYAKTGKTHDWSGDYIKEIKGYLAKKERDRKLMPKGDNLKGIEDNIANKTPEQLQALKEDAKEFMQTGKTHDWSSEYIEEVKAYLRKNNLEGANTRKDVKFEKKSGNTYDEMGKKVVENRKKMANASPEEKRKLINENHDLMTKMDQTMQNVKPVKKETAESLQEEYNKLHERLGYVHERSTIAGINSRLDEISKKLNKKLQEEKKSSPDANSAGQVTHYTDINKVPKKLKPGEQYALYLKKGKMPEDGGKFAGQTYDAEYQGKGTYGVSNPKNMSPMAGFKTYEAMKKAYEERSNTPGQSYEIAIIKNNPSKEQEPIEKKKATPEDYAKKQGLSLSEMSKQVANHPEASKMASKLMDGGMSYYEAGALAHQTYKDKLSNDSKIESAVTKGSPSEFKNRDEAEAFYRNKFAGVSATYANKMAKKLGIEGRGKDKREALAKHYADQWETNSNVSKNEDEKAKQIARNEAEKKQAEEQKPSNTPTEKKLPKYSNEQGYILSSTVQADSRYENIKNTFEEFKTERKNYKTGEYEMRGNGFLADDFLRRLMKEEEKGETSGEMTVDVWNGESLRDKMKAYRAALKAAGYRVVSSDNDDRINHGYMGARGRRVYSSTERARTLHYEKNYGTDLSRSRTSDAGNNTSSGKRTIEQMSAAQADGMRKLKEISSSKRFNEISFERPTTGDKLRVSVEKVKTRNYWGKPTGEETYTLNIWNNSKTNEYGNYEKEYYNYGIKDMKEVKSIIKRYMSM